MGVFTLTITKSDSIKDEYTNTLKLLIFMLYYAYFKQMYGNPINEHLFDQINTIEDSPSFNITILKILKGIMNTSYDNESLISDIANQILNALNKELDFSSIIEEFLGYLKLYITEQEDIIKYEEDQIKLTQNLHFEEYNYIILALASINYYIDTENNYLLSMLQFNSTIEQNYAFEKELIPKIDTDTTLLPYALTASASASATASASASATASASASASAIVTATASAIFDIDKPYTKDLADKFASNDGFMQDFVEDLQANNFEGDVRNFITYLKLAEYIITTRSDSDLGKLFHYRGSAEDYLHKASIYAEELLAQFNDTDMDEVENYDKIHKANAILFIVNGKKKTEEQIMLEREAELRKTFASLTKDNIDINEVKPITIKFKKPSISTGEIEVEGYTLTQVDRGGGGDCFYFSVWGCLIDLGQPAYESITTKLKALGDSMKDGYVNFAETFTDITSKNAKAGTRNHTTYNDCRSRFNINIRKLLALCLLIDTHWYNAMKNDYLANGLLNINQSMAFEYANIIKQKLTEQGLDPNRHNEFIHNNNNEHNIILSNMALIPGIWGDEVTVSLLKVLLSMCDVILDIFIEHLIPVRLPRQVKDTFYIYLINIGRAHFKEIKTEENKGNCIFERVGNFEGYVPNHGNYWKLK